MIIIPVSHGLEDILGVSTGPRSSGLHASAIYGSLFQELEPKRYKKDSQPDPLRLEVGLALESMLEEGLQRRMEKGERPEEFLTEEGIAYSPDLLFFEKHRIVLGEIKATWMSSREVPRTDNSNFPPRFDKWFVQMKFYIRNLQRYFGEQVDGRLFAFFLNGNYAPPSPELLCWDLKFTDQELEECHRMLINHAKSQGML